MASSDRLSSANQQPTLPQVRRPFRNELPDRHKRRALPCRSRNRPFPIEHHVQHRPHLVLCFVFSSVFLSFFSSSLHLLPFASSSSINDARFPHLLSVCLSLLHHFPIPSVRLHGFFVCFSLPSNTPDLLYPSSGRCPSPPFVAHSSRCFGVPASTFYHLISYVRDLLLSQCDIVADVNELKGIGRLTD